MIRPGAVEIKDYPEGKWISIPVNARPSEARWSPDGRWLATSGGGGLFLIDSVKHQVVKSIELKTQDRRISWSPDSKHLAVPNGDEPKISILDINEMKLSKEIVGHSGEVSAADWSPNGRRLATAEGPNILLWDMSSWELLGVLRKHRQKIRDLACD